MSLIEIAINIHDMWLIEEKAKIFRSEVKLNPPQAPIKADRIAEMEMILIRVVFVVR